MPDVAILVFSRAPVPGESKTRLVPALGEEGAARVHRFMLRRTVAVAASVEIGPVHLVCTPTRTHEAFLALEAQFGVALRLQRGGDLGARMANAARAALSGQPGGAIIVGSDCPGITAGDLRRTAAWLRAGVDAVLGPSLDGGYYLIALRRLDGALFRDIRWGTAAVLAETRRRLERLRWTWRELECRADVDTPEDLLHYPELCQARPGEPDPPR